MLTLQEMNFRIFVYLQGDTKFLLCTVDSAESVAAVISTLCKVSQPEYLRLEIELFRPLSC